MRTATLGGLALAAALLVSTAAAEAAGPDFDACAAEAASPYERGYAETGKEDYAVDVGAAIAACLGAIAAEPDSAQVKTWLARAHYLNGSHEAAFALLDPLPLRKNPLAADILGVMLRGGGGLPADLTRSVEVLKAAAEAGFAPAQYDYARAFDNGFGVVLDYAIAGEWYQKAAAQGLPKAVAAVGSMHLWGDGMPFDEAEGLRMLNEAGAKGEPLAWQYLGVAYASAPNLGNDYEKAAEAFQKASDLGDAYSMVELGWYYDQGLGVPQDFTKAFEWTRKGGELGNAHGLSNLAYYYENGVGTEVDLVKAFEAAKRSAELGSIYGAVGAGWYYLKGIGTEVNCDEALYWTNIAYAANDINAIENLGEHYHRGCGIGQDLARAKELYTIALQGGSTTAQPLLDELRKLMKISNEL